MLPKLLGDRLELLVVQQDLELDAIDPTDGVFLPRLDERGGRGADDEFDDPGRCGRVTGEEKGPSSLSDFGCGEERAEFIGETEFLKADSGELGRPTRTKCGYVMVSYQGAVRGPKRDVNVCSPFECYDEQRT